jgi:hypothetical protein
MAFMELLPPSTLPLGQYSDRPRRNMNFTFAIRRAGFDEQNADVGTLAQA